MTEQKIVLKIGGSILFNENLNINFQILEKVKQWYWNILPSVEKIAIVVGGGYLSREIQSKMEGEIKEEQALHNIAMQVTQTNAALVQGYINDVNSYLPKKLGDAYEFLKDPKGKTLISGGLKVGWSTDMDAAVFANILDVNRVIKLSNIDYVYDSDPDTNPNALPIKDLTWKEYFKLAGISDGDGHIVNKSMPIDAPCSQFCEKKKISFYICGGKNLLEKNSIEEILSTGTLIH